MHYVLVSVYYRFLAKLDIVPHCMDICLHSIRCSIIYQTLKSLSTTMTVIRNTHHFPSQLFVIVHKISV